MKGLYLVLLLCICSSSLLFSEGEFIIDTNYVSFPGVGNKFCPEAAFDGTNYMIVWTDYRNGSPAIYGTRVSQDGVILDTFGIAIETDRWAQDPAVAFDGTNYFVVWREYRDIYDWPEPFVDAVAGVRISTDGIVIDTSSITVFFDSINLGIPECPEIAFDGVNYLVVWDIKYGLSPRGVGGTRVSPAGVVLDDPPIQISSVWQGTNPPSLVFGVSNYLVVWDIYGNVYATRVSTDGTVLDPEGIPVCTTWTSIERNPSVSFDGTNFFVVYQTHPWLDSLDSTHYRVEGRRVNQSGTLIDTTAICISDTVHSYALQTTQCPDVVFDGTYHVVIWHGGNWNGGNVNGVIAGSRVTPEGVDLDPDDQIIDGPGQFIEYNAHIALGSDNLLVVYQVRLGPWTNARCYRIEGVLINPDLSMIDLLKMNQIVRIPGKQTWSASAFDGSNYLVCWQDRHYGPLAGSVARLYGIRVNSVGLPLDESAIALGSSGLSNYPNMVSPDIAYGGSVYLAVWAAEHNFFDIHHGAFTAEYDVYGTRVLPTGIVLDTLGINISSYCLNPYDYDGNPAVSFDGQKFFVVWEHFSWDNHPWNEYDSDIYGKRVAQDGSLLDSAALVINCRSGAQILPKLAFNSSLYLVVWEDNAASNDNSEIYGARVDTAGSVLDPQGFPISLATRDQCVPVVAFDGVNFLVAWQDGRHAGQWWYDSTVIYCSRVTPSGAVLDPQGIRISALDKVATSPQVCFDGINYLVVWEQYTDDGTYDLYGAKVSPSGNVINNYVVASHAYDQIEPALCRGNGDQILVTYTSKTTNLGNRGIRVERIWGKMYPFVGVEEKSSAAPAHNKCRLQVTNNPFSARRPVQFTITMGAVHQNLSLKIYDVLGRLLKTYAIKPEPGHQEYSISWKGDDALCRKVSSGIYCCRLETDAGAVVATEKIVFIY